LSPPEALRRFPIPNPHTGTFTFLATGGTGSAYWLPDLELNGLTNESNNLDLQDGGFVTSTWPFFIDVGDPYGWASPQDPGFFYCEPQNCEIPFTYGVEQTFTVTLTASSIIIPNPIAPQLPWAQGVTTSAEFNGVMTFSSCPDQLCIIVPPTYSLEQVTAESSDPPSDPPTPVPEPGSWINVASATMLIWFLRFSRLPKPRQSLLRSFVPLHRASRSKAAPYPLSSD
jgi:hypothetical protein